MEKRKPKVFRREWTQILSLVLLSACPLIAGDGWYGSSVGNKELSKRGANVQEAQELLVSGDAAYLDRRYEEAAAAYSGALELLPDAPATADLKRATVQRYAQAATEQARGMTRKGDVAGAKALMDKVLAAEVAPNDPGASQLRAELDDPIRTNPALTAEHARDIDKVRRELYLAEGAFDLGKFDESKQHYETVLRIDPANIAARRGMERVAAAKSNYQKSAYDHARSEMLAEVDGSWELKIPAPDLGLGPMDPGTDFGGAGLERTVAAKLEQIVLSSVNLDQTTLGEAIDFIRLRAAEADTTSSSSDRGINILMDLSAADTEKSQRILNQRFDLRIKQVPIAQALKYICDITQTDFIVDEFVVKVVPAGSTSDALKTQTFRVPPDFITSLSAGVSVSADQAEDPFSEGGGGGGLLTERLTAQEALEKNGVSFPEGANAAFSAATSSLTVTNTALNLDIVDQIVEGMTKSEPVAVSVKVTMIRTQQTNLEELGFDWLVNPFPLNAGNDTFASGGTLGNGTPRTGADMVSPVGGTSVDSIPADPGAAVNQGLMTNGLRSGDAAVSQNAIDSLVNNFDRTSQGSSVAPGVMAVTGLFSDAQVQGLMRGLDQKKGTDMLAQPATVTRSGQASKVEVIREFIYPTEYEPPELPNSSGGGIGGGGILGGGGGGFPVTPATPTAFETRDVGITLEVLPVADSNRRFVDVTLNPSFSDFDGFVNYGSPINTNGTDALGNPTTSRVTDNRILMPIFSAQRAATQLTVADGATIVIGSLLTDRVQDVEDQVPIFGSIPLVGRMFQSTAKQKVSTALIMMVKVQLLDPTGRPYRDR